MTRMYTVELASALAELALASALVCYSLFLLTCKYRVHEDAVQGPVGGNALGPAVPAPRGGRQSVQQVHGLGVLRESARRKVLLEVRLLGPRSGRAVKVLSSAFAVIIAFLSGFINTSILRRNGFACCPLKF